MTSNMTRFDIPVEDLDRTARFYSAASVRPVKVENTGSIPVGILPTADGGSVGCLVTSNSGL
jgi:predicted enzyme related to lactoylglutathione lyase